ncbi:hypothetical protein QWY86_16465 [Pedobacter aquatilis]|uniref:hypothetical protein n=1 Tax=Pedobacter aquatilis TaxID=351343 RepID=UPI0025B5E023|nr:hypothetical protein [Pedobacter aquatilis]MDN3588278.1 hypothetical protein [Pedobacter aquatilis]
MKKPLLILSVLAIIATGCNSNKADEKNADSLYKYTDTTKVTDSLSTDSTADSLTNAPADVKH